MGSVLTRVLSRLEVAAAWPNDFFTLCVRDMPREFRESPSKTVRGQYVHKVALVAEKLSDGYRFSPDESVEQEVTEEAIKDFARDVQKVWAKRKSSEGDLRVTATYRKGVLLFINVILPESSND
jgi:hypothetical protein